MGSADHWSKSCWESPVDLIARCLYRALHRSKCKRPPAVGCLRLTWRGYPVRRIRTGEVGSGRHFGKSGKGGHD